MCARRANPGGAWPYQTGQDFLPNHLVDGVDFASVHMWPDNWDRTDQAFGRAWLDAHMKDAYYLGKPVVLEEFGKAIGAAPPARTPLDENPTKGWWVHGSACCPGILVLPTKPEEDGKGWRLPQEFTHGLLGAKPAC